MVCSLEQGRKERRGLRAATGEKGWAELLVLVQLQPRKEGGMFQRWHCILVSLSDLLWFHFFNSVFSKWRRTLNLILNIERELWLQFLPMSCFQNYNHEVVRFCTPLLGVRKRRKEYPNKKCITYPPNEFKQGKESSPQLQIFSLFTCLQHPFPPHLLCTRWLSKGKYSLCSVTRFQPRDGMRNMRMLAKMGYVQ